MLRVGHLPCYIYTYIYYMTDDGFGILLAVMDCWMGCHLVVSTFDDGSLVLCGWLVGERVIGLVLGLMLGLFRNRRCLR
jgi:hypothetical protein